MKHPHKKGTYFKAEKVGIFAYRIIKNSLPLNSATLGKIIEVTLLKVDGMEITLPELHLLNGLVIWVVEFSRKGYNIIY